MDTYAPEDRGTRAEEQGEGETTGLDPEPSTLDPAKRAIGVFGGTFDPVHNGICASTWTRWNSSISTMCD
jgi:hypothetical protein